MWPLHSRAGEGSRLRRPSGTPATRRQQRRCAAATNAGGTRRGCGDPDQHGSPVATIAERGAGCWPRDVCRRAGGPRRQRNTPSRLQKLYWSPHSPSSASPRHWSRMAMVPLLKLLAAPGGRLVQGNTPGECVEGVANDCTTCRGVQRPSSQASVHTRRRTAAVQFPEPPSSRPQQPIHCISGFHTGPSFSISTMRRAAGAVCVVALLALAGGPPGRSPAPVNSQRH